MLLSHTCTDTHTTHACKHTHTCIFVHVHTLYMHSCQLYWAVCWRPWFYYSGPTIPLHSSLLVNWMVNVWMHQILELMMVPTFRSVANWSKQFKTFYSQLAYKFLYPHVISQYVINFAHEMQEENASEWVSHFIDLRTYITTLHGSFLKAVVTCTHFAAYGKSCVYC